MIRVFRLALRFLLAVSAFVRCGAAQDAADEASLSERLSAEIEPILIASCVGCHGETEAWAGLRLDGIETLNDAVALRHDLAIARERVELREMPPPGYSDPTEAERQALLDWLADLAAYQPEGERPTIDPGWFTVRRLNTDEYQATMRDLLGIDPATHDITLGLPPDDLGYGFDTIADVLTTSTLHLEAYLESAERALDIALGPPADLSMVPRRLALRSDGGGRETREGGVYLYSSGAAYSEIDLPIRATYRIRVTTRGDRGGEDLPRLQIAVDGESVLEADITATQQGQAQLVEVTTTLDGNAELLEARFTNDYFKRGVADRNLLIESVELTGPITVSDEDRPAMYRAVIIAQPDGTAAGDRSAARSVLGSFADRAYRRPLDDRELESLVGLYDRARFGGDGHERGLRTALIGCLVSPQFLYRSAANPRPDEPALIHRLTGHELASRLSYFLWSSMPDGELRRLADLDLLDDERVLRAQVRRMLTDPKADLFVERFAGQWLLLRQLETMQIDRETHPAYTPELRDAMIAEATHAFGDLVRRNGAITELIDADAVFINEQLASHYGIPDVLGPAIRKVRLDQNSPRGGVLTSSAVLTLTSNPSRTSPVKRGLFVLDQFLGTPPPPPPPDIAPLEQAKAALGPNPTLREQLAAHVADPSCAACHVQMDPIGLAMENFDALGRWRDEAYGTAIDASGSLPSGESFDGPAQLKQVLLAREPQIRRNLTERLMIYALGRGLEPFDRGSVDRVMQQADAIGGGIADLIETVVLSETFRACRARRTP